MAKKQSARGGTRHLQGGSEGITHAVLRLRQASQGRFLRLRGCLARPNWLWMVNLRGRACWPWTDGSAPLSMSCVSRGEANRGESRPDGRLGLVRRWLAWWSLCDPERGSSRVARRTRRPSRFQTRRRVEVQVSLRLVQVGRHKRGTKEMAPRVEEKIASRWPPCRRRPSVMSNVTRTAAGSHFAYLGATKSTDYGAI